MGETLTFNNVWRKWRPFYKFTWAVWQNRSYQHIASYLNKLENACVLDIGTGTGEYIRYLNPQSSCKYIFTDPDELALEVAKKYAIEKGLDCEFIVGFADDVIQQVDFCTHVTLVHVLSVIKNPFQFVELLRLKYGGQVKIFAYLSRFNATNGGSIRCRGLGFQRLNKNKLSNVFSKKRICVLNVVYWT